MIGDILATRTVFERWMKCYPNEQAWLTYIKFEQRCGRTDAARKLYERMIQQIPEASVPLSRPSHLGVHQVREVGGTSRQQGELSQGLRAVADGAVSRERRGRPVRAEGVSHSQLPGVREVRDSLPGVRACACDLPLRTEADDASRHAVGAGRRFERRNTEYTLFEKQFGNRETVEAAIVNTRRAQYEEALSNTPYNYDVWFDYLRMLEQEGQKDKVIDAYERAIKNVPPSKEKRFWRRYIYLWIYYAVYLECDLGDVDRARDVYQRCLQCIPHKSFTFGKVGLADVSEADLDSLRETGAATEQSGQGAKAAGTVDRSVSEAQRVHVLH